MLFSFVGIVLRCINILYLLVISILFALLLVIIKFSGICCVRLSGPQPGFAFRTLLIVPTYIVSHLVLIARDLNFRAHQVDAHNIRPFLLGV